jgi:hypothetical protein
MVYQLCDRCLKHKGFKLRAALMLGSFRFIRDLNKWTWSDFEEYMKENRTKQNQPFSLRNIGKLTHLSHEHVREAIREADWETRSWIMWI